jgi:hypothetical protein
MIKRIPAPILEGQGDLFIAGHCTYFLGPMAEGCRRLWRFSPSGSLPRDAIATTTLETPTDDQLLDLLAP